MKFVKFHIIIHLTSHMKQGSVPMMIDTGTSKSCHKPTKTVAMLIHKRFDTFDQQTNEHLLSLAMEGMAERLLRKTLKAMTTCQLLIAVLMALPPLVPS